jgi:hypothetical protein
VKLAYFLLVEIRHLVAGTGIGIACDLSEIMTVTGYSSARYFSFVNTALLSDNLP